LLTFGSWDYLDNKIMESYLETMESIYWRGGIAICVKVWYIKSQNIIICVHSGKISFE